MTTSEGLVSTHNQTNDLIRDMTDISDDNSTNGKTSESVDNNGIDSTSLSTKSDIIVDKEIPISFGILLVYLLLIYSTAFFITFIVHLVLNWGKKCS